MVKIDHAVSLECLQDLHNGRSQGKRHAQFMTGFEYVSNVLDVDAERASGFEIPVEHHRHFRVHNGAAGKSAANCLVDEFGIDPCPGGKHQRFRNCSNVELDDDL